MKLNYKRTICVGFAFFLICAFWQAYDNTIPLILTNKFGMSQAWSGVIMALDNILALFLLPLFGAISDKTHTRIGKRMPFILFGTGCAVILMNILPLLDNSYAAQPSGFKTASFVIVLGLLLVAMGGMFSEHSGVINLGLEGIMVIGALGGALTMRYLPAGTSNFVMVLLVILASIAGGMLYSVLLAVSAINCKADQTIVRPDHA